MAESPSTMCGEGLLGVHPVCTCGARDLLEAVRLPRLAPVASDHECVKVDPEPNHLLPDGVQALAAARVLVAEG